MAELFDVNVPAISKHLRNIYEEGELHKEATISKMETVQHEGTRKVTRNMDFYNLDAIIAVGYRVNSKRATQFRIWATGILKEYIIKGFAMDDDRVKEVEKWDYFDEWLERIRDIRASEKRFYQKIRCTNILLPHRCVIQQFLPGSAWIRGLLWRGNVDSTWPPSPFTKIVNKALQRTTTGGADEFIDALV